MISGGLRFLEQGSLWFSIHKHNQDKLLFENADLIHVLETVVELWLYKGLNPVWILVDWFFSSVCSYQTSPVVVEDSLMLSEQMISILIFLDFWISYNHKLMKAQCSVAAHHYLTLHKLILNRMKIKLIWIDILSQLGVIHLN